MDINATLLGQMITFAIFVWFSYTFVWPVINSAMDDRRKKIAAGLEAAKDGHEKLAQAGDKYNSLLSEAKTRSDAIILLAKKQGNQIIDDSRKLALSERDEIIESGHTQVDQELNKVKLVLQKNMASLIIACSEKVIAKTINIKEHSTILEKFIKKL